MKPIIIDVREPEEFAQGHAAGAINIPPSQLQQGADTLRDVDRNTPLVVYCVSGSRSNAAIPYLQQLGFHDITNGINQNHVTKNYL